MVRLLSWRTSILMAFLLCTGVSADAQDTLSRFQSAQKTAEAGGWTRARQIFEEIAVQDPQLPEAAWNAAFLARKTEQWEICAMYYRFYLERVPEASDKDATEHALSYCERKIENRGTIDVRTTPADAKIYVDGLPFGEGELRNLVLSPGTHRLTVDLPHYDSYDERIQVTGGVNQEFSVRLKETVYEGTLVLDVDQADAVVRIDGIQVGTTPLPVEGIPHRAKKKVLLTIEKDGFRRWQRYITLQPNASYNLEVRLLPDLDAY